MYLNKHTGKDNILLSFMPIYMSISCPDTRNIILLINSNLQYSSWKTGLLRNNFQTHAKAQTWNESL